MFNTVKVKNVTSKQLQMVKKLMLRSVASIYFML